MLSLLIQEGRFSSGPYYSSHTTALCENQSYDHKVLALVVWFKVQCRNQVKIKGSKNQNRKSGMVDLQQKLVHRSTFKIQFVGLNVLRMQFKFMIHQASQNWGICLRLIQDTIVKTKLLRSQIWLQESELPTRNNTTVSPMSKDAIQTCDLYNQFSATKWEN
jgi:hypothetical protein